MKSYEIRPGDMLRFKNILKNRLDDERYNHSLNTSARAVQRARLDGEDWYRAAAAGLLHDISACDTTEYMIDLLGVYVLDEETLLQPKLWHARCGEILLRDMGVKDEDVLSAVRYHTTGKAAMSKLEMIVYLADKTSSERDYNEVEELRRVSDENLEAAMRMSLVSTVKMLVQIEMPIVEDAWNAYNYYL